MKYINWKETDPTINLAFEEYVFNQMDKNESYFLLWQNDGLSLVYNLREKRKCDFGLITVLLQVEKGIIKEISFFGDYFGNGDIKELEALFVGVKPNEVALIPVLEEIQLESYINGLDSKILIDLILY